METEKRPGRRVLILLVVVILLLVGVLAAAAFKGVFSSHSDDGTPKIGYAQGVTVVEDPDALQKAVDDMLEKVAEGSIALEYKNDAYSEDGLNFDCYIANSLNNSYDMYIQMFADKGLTDQLLLTGLIRPGAAFDEITLEHELEPGTSTVYVAFTQVEEDMETIHGQVIVTMDLHVE